VEPGDGYAYDTFLEAFSKRWVQHPRTLLYDLVETYGESYSGGTQGRRQVTQTGMDLRKLPQVKAALNVWLPLVEQAAGPNGSTVLRKIAEKTQYYYERDYRDLGDYARLVLNRYRYHGGKVNRELDIATSNLQRAIRELVINNFNSEAYKRSTGV